MNRTNQLGENIRGLRLAHRETQEQLGMAINVEKNTISSYETGRTEPRKDILTSIAAHYMVSIEELLTRDFSDLDEIIVDPESFWEALDLMFPIIKTKKALQNEHFKKAYSAQCILLEKLKEQTFEDADHVMNCIAEYGDAMEDKNAVAEAAANTICFLYLLLFIIKPVPQTIKNQTALITLIQSQHPETKSCLEDLASVITPEIENSVRELADSELHRLISELIQIVKSSESWWELGDYYLALQYSFDFFDTGLTPELSQCIGTEMLHAFASVGNVYAINFFSL